MTDSENLHVLNECETDVCVDLLMIVFKKSQQSRLWTNHKGTDEKGVQVDNTHLGFKGTMRRY